MAAGPQLIKQEAECKGFTGFDLVLEGREASAALMSGSATSIHKDDQRQRLELVILAGLELWIISRESAEALPPLTYQVFASRSSVGTVSCVLRGVSPSHGLRWRLGVGAVSQTGPLA
jgi:hypothetical protein